MYVIGHLCIYVSDRLSHVYISYMYVSILYYHQYVVYIYSICVLVEFIFFNNVSSLVCFSGVISR